MKKNIYKFVLPIICACSACLLSVVNMITSPKINEYENKQKLIALEEISLGNDIGDCITVEDNPFVTNYYELSNNSVCVGYILSLNTSGYGGPISLVASYDIDGKIIRVKMLSNSETPGIGKKSENKEYMNMFIGTGSILPVPLKKDQLNSDSLSIVSGATLTFTGISKALSAGSDFIKLM